MSINVSHQKLQEKTSIIHTQLLYTIIYNHILYSMIVYYTLWYHDVHCDNILLNLKIHIPHVTIQYNWTAQCMFDVYSIYYYDYCHQSTLLIPDDQ